MSHVTVYDLVLLHDHFFRKKEPTYREKAAVEKLNDELLALAEGIQRVGPLPSAQRGE